MRPAWSRRQTFRGGRRSATPQHLDMQETVKPIEENGFLLMDFTPETITLRYFKWNQKTQPVSDINTLEPFHTAELKRLME